MIEVTKLIQLAREKSGLADFGADGWQEGLEVLVGSVNREARLNDQGHASFTGLVTMLLTCRLEIEDWYTRHPEIDEQEIVAPLMILGLPRTGSSALHCLLGEDPVVRLMHAWESMMPCPPPEQATYETDPRIALTAGFFTKRDGLSPRLKQMMPSSPTTPTEDQLTMGYDFKSQMFQASLRVPAYTE